MADENIKKERKKKKRKIRKPGSLHDSVTFQLKDVIAVGGDKEDYEMLKDIDASNDYAGVDMKDVESVSKHEVMSLIQELGLDKVQIGVKDERDEGVGDRFVEDESMEKVTPRVGTQTLDKTVSLAPHGPSKCSESQKSRSMPLLRDKVLLWPTGCRWYNQIPPEEPKPLQSAGQSDVIHLHQEAIQLWENEVALYQKVKASDKSSDSIWLKTVTSSGTLGDKLAGLTVQIQESPVHQMKNLDILIAMAKKKGRRECLMAVDTLKELWLADLLPEERKLKKFAQHPLSSLEGIALRGGGRDSRDKRLILWHFEDLLKQRYADFVAVIERLLHDTLTDIRSKALGLVFDLLSQRPEQEQVLLSKLVNKVGDPDRKVATKAAHLLRCMVMKHPNMKFVVTKEVEKLLYRPNISTKAQYYAVCFLNQMILTKRDGDLASKLIQIYFSFFESFIKKGDVEAKMLAALLTGVNRAFPYAKEGEDKYDEQLNTLFRTVHVGTFSTSVQALLLLFQVMESRQCVSDRFYQALYAKLFDPSLKASSKQAMFLNVLYKALKVDPSLPRVKAFVKRLVQVCSVQQPAFVCGVLYLVSELARLKPGIRSLIQQPEEDDDEEHFVDIPDSENDEENGCETKDETQNGAKNETSANGGARTVHDDKTKAYQPQIRNPLYCGAERSCIWELIRMSQHYHPSVCVFARTVLRGEVIEYSGDPLQDFTLMRFLDRFIYKNPKKQEKEHGGSLMQPKSSSSRRSEDPVNSKAFLAKKEENIREDELFFYRFFKRKAEEEEFKQNKMKARKAKEYEDDDDDAIDNVPDEPSTLDFDFASELRKSKDISGKRKRRKADSEDEDDESEEDEDVSGPDDSSGDEFDYGDLDVSAEDEDEAESTLNAGAKKKFTTAEYEKALLANLSSEESADEETRATTSKTSKKARGIAGKDNISSLFASAEEFAHLLEDSSPGGSSHDVSRKNASDKQLHWERRKMEQGRQRKRKRPRLRQNQRKNTRKR